MRSVIVQIYRRQSLKGKVNDHICEFGWLTRFSDEVEVSDVLADGCALGMAIDETGKWDASSLQVFSIGFETNVMGDKHAALLTREL